jgi:hypothetical protein
MADYDIEVTVPTRGPQGPQGTPGEQTTDAALLTSGTLADARLSANVPLKDAANTFASSQTLNGTANVAPNQTAASDGSLMTRDLVDANPLFALCNVRALGAYAFGNSGTGSGTFENYVRGGASINSGTAATGYARMSIYRGINNASGFTGSGINFAQQISVSALLSVSLTTADTVHRLVIGGNGGVPAASDADALAVQGFGVELAQSGANARARLFCRNATTYATSAYTSDFNMLAQFYVIVSSNGAGVVRLFLEGASANNLAPSRVSATPALTLSGGPTGASTGVFIDIVSVNPAAATVATSSSIAFFGGWLQVK